VSSYKTNKQSILLLGNYRPTLPLAKMFADQGYEVICGSQGCEIDFKQSRYVSQIWEHPDAKKSPKLFFKELQRFCKHRPELTAIFPVLEEYVRLFADHKEWMENLPSIIMTPPELVLKCVDKLYTMQLAETCSIPIAPFAKVHDEVELNQATEKIGLPIVVRPSNATVALNGKKAVAVRSSEEIKNLNVDWDLHAQGLILQRRFNGIRHNIYFAAFEGKICRYLHAVITRTHCIDGSGLAVEGITVEPDENLRKQTEKLVGALNYSGVGCAQYLVNDVTGETSFLEINPRIAGNHAVPEHAGLQLGKFLTDLALTGQPDLTPRTGRIGIRYAWISTDLIAAKTAWRKGEIGTKATLKWMLRILIVTVGSPLHMVFSWADPKPGLFALAHALPGVCRLLDPTGPKPQTVHDSKVRFNPQSACIKTT